MIVLENFADGKLLEPFSGHYLDCINPATGTIYAKVPESTSEDLEIAVRAAKQAFPGWSITSRAHRFKILNRLADLIRDNADELAQAESIDTGKPLQLASTVDIPRAAANFRFYASAIINESTEAHLMEDEAVNYTRRAPLGIVGCISPWNLPLYLLTWKIAPALATGNCVIAKPSEITPYTAYILSKLTIEAGFPSGVLNILHGSGKGIGSLIVEHPEIKAISFTGGTATGRQINQAASYHFKKVSLELGGKNPVLIFEDCDFELAVKNSVRSAFTNQGEICLCGSRIFIHKSIYERFKKAFLKEVKQMTVGNPLDPVDIGAVISADHLKKISNYVEEAKTSGATILAGGHRIEIGDGFFYAPTVIEGQDCHSKINQEEVFGPVVTLTPFDDEASAVAMANCTRYGLASIIWTNDLKRAHRVAHQMQSGIVWVNCWMLRDLRTPFGGTKESGIGREGGSDALRFFTEAQNICIKL